jgi:hypothetical protein
MTILAKEKRASLIIIAMFKYFHWHAFADTEVGAVRRAAMFAQRWFYLDVFACGVFVTSKNVPEAPARARQCRPTGRRAQGIFGAERPSTRPNEVVVRAAGKTCCVKLRVR